MKRHLRIFVSFSKVKGSTCCRTESLKRKVKQEAEFGTGERPSRRRCHPGRVKRRAGEG
jgi:hypothetical protein